jgi:hypothetical protein
MLNAIKVILLTVILYALPLVANADTWRGMLERH